MVFLMFSALEPGQPRGLDLTIASSSQTHHFSQTWISHIFHDPGVNILLEDLTYSSLSQKLTLQLSLFSPLFYENDDNYIRVSPEGQGLRSYIYKLQQVRFNEGEIMKATRQELTCPCGHKLSVKVNGSKATRTCPACRDEMYINSGTYGQPASYSLEA